MLGDGSTLCFFDFTDPGSYLMSRLLESLEVRWRGFELRVPPEAVVDPRAPDWARYQRDMAELAEALDLEMASPRFIPWTRKAHELAIHARDRDCSQAVRDALFRAHFVDGRDIGRIDVLVDVAAWAGLDRTEAKAVLDVDRHTDEVASDRALAQELGVVGVPTLVRGSDRLEGVRSRRDIVKWLEAG